MTGRHYSFLRLMTLLWAVGIAASVAGCGRTLVFAERDGVNLAIRANASSSPPIEVNFGLNRTIATIVPPASEGGGKPSGEAVNMFAGFQVEQPTPLDPAKPLDVDLKIDTQFASGAAARNVAGNPTVVARIVNVNSTTIQRTPGFVESIDIRQQRVAAINDLSDDQAVAVARSMLPNLPARSDFIRTALGPNVAAIQPGGTIPPAIARDLLRRWAALDTVTPGTTAEWAAAFAQAKP